MHSLTRDRRRVLGLLSASGLVGAVVIAVLIGRERPRDAEKLEPEFGEQTLAGEGVVASRSAESTDSRDPLRTASPPTAAEVLEDYWGARWPEVLERLRAAGKAEDLDKPFELAPWEEVETEITQKLLPADEMLESLRTSSLRWPEVLDESFVRNEYSTGQEIKPSDLLEIERIAEPFNADLRLLSDQYANDLALIIRHEVGSGRFERTPRSTSCLPKREEPVFYATSTGKGGWAARVELTYAQFPELDALTKQMQDLWVRRHATVAKWLQDHRR